MELSLSRRGICISEICRRRYRRLCSGWPTLLGQSGRQFLVLITGHLRSTLSTERGVGRTPDKHLRCCRDVGSE